MPEHARPEGDVVVDRLRERVRLLEDHADAAPHLDRIDVARVEVLAVVENLPSTFAPGTRSFIRLKQRISVLLPQPDGPMNAVIAFLKTSRFTSRIATLPLYETARSLTWKTASRFDTRSSPCCFAMSARLIGSIVDAWSATSGRPCSRRRNRFPFRNVSTAAHLPALLDRQTGDEFPTVGTGGAEW